MLVVPVEAGTGNSSTGWPAMAAVMKSCQIEAGMLPPDTFANPSIAVHRHPALRVADPHAGRELGRVAAEPRVAVLLRGSGLAGHRPVDGRRGAGPRGHHPCSA